MRKLPENMILKMEHNVSCFVPKTLTPLLHDADRYRDLIGPDIHLVMRHTGWTFVGYPAIATCTRETDGFVAAVGWCAPIRWIDGKPGLNLSYACHPDFAGQGLATLAVLRSFASYLEDVPSAVEWTVNIQCDSQNHASIALARKLAFEPNGHAEFAVPDLHRRFLAFSQPATELLQLALPTLSHQQDDSRTLRDRGNRPTSA